MWCFCRQEFGTGTTAAEMLLHGDESMSEIGQTVGWPDQNYFARRFKAHFGLSGTTYRERFAPQRETADPPGLDRLTGV
jgi:AraC-like DNA-binding protein